MYAIFNGQSFNDTLTNEIVTFEQLGPDIFGYIANASRIYPKRSEMLYSFIFYLNTDCRWTRLAFNSTVNIRATF